MTDLPTTTANLLLTGSELNRGEIHDLNGPFLARELTKLAFTSWVLCR